MAKRYSYYPGCVLHGTSREYDISIQAVFKKLGVELNEIEDWNCCGQFATDNLLLLASLCGRNLQIAERMGLDLTIPCSICYHNLMKSRRILKENQKIREKAGSIGIGFNEKIKIRHLLEIVSLKELAAAKLKPLNLKVAPFYGCLTIRPKELTFEDPANPRSLDELIRATGAECLPFASKTQCCGGNLLLGYKELALKLTGNILLESKKIGSDCIVVACPMCHVMLDSQQAEIEAKFGKDIQLPVLYFTQLLGLALEIKPKELGLDKHAVSTKQIVEKVKG